jgi:OOP family OmpA-OmpF porin
MSRSSLLSILAVIVLIAFGLFFWSTGTQMLPPAPPAPAPAPQTAAQTPAPAPAPAAPGTAPAPAPAAQPPAPEPQTATQAPAPAPAPTAAPAAEAAAQAPAPAPAPTAQPPAPEPQTAAQAPAPAPAPAADATAAQPPAPPTVATAAAALSEDDAAKEAADLESRANEKAKGELASLGSAFDAKSLTAALNDSVVNFPSGGAEVPARMADLLENAADDLKKLPAGQVLEIAGYTDNTGNAADNVTLSQARAGAVRDAFIKYGVSPDMLVAKGYGSADPIASNDTPQGRLRNRRIEYHVLKTP